MGERVGRPGASTPAQHPAAPFCTLPSAAVRRGNRRRRGRGRPGASSSPGRLGAAVARRRTCTRAAPVAALDAINADLDSAGTVTAEVPTAAVTEAVEPGKPRRARSHKFQEFVAGRGNSVVTEHVGSMLATRDLGRLTCTAHDLKNA